MSAVLKRLQDNYGFILPNEDTQFWEFSDKLEKKEVNFFLPLLHQQPELLFEYSVVRTQLNDKNINAAELKNQLMAALMLSELLEHLSRYYLDVPREVHNFREEQKVFRKLLGLKGITFKAFKPYLPKPGTFTRTLRDKAALYNLWRLLVVRARRVFSAIATIVTTSPTYVWLVKMMEKYTNAFFAYFAWLFFLPRLITNLVLLFKHLIPGSWMSKTEKTLGFFHRFLLQLRRRGFELGNDIPWPLFNCLSLFFFISGLALVGSYIGIAMFFYDVLLSGIRAFVELVPLYKLRKQYEKQAKGLINSEEYKNFKKHLDERIRFEEKRLLISFSSLSALAILMLLSAPAIIANPIVPVVCAVLLFVVTLTTYILNQLLEKKRPCTQINEQRLSHCFTLFKPAPVINPDPIEEVAALETILVI